MNKTVLYNEYDYLISHNIPHNFAIGLLANQMTETANTFEPNVVQLSYINNGKVKSKEDYVNRVNNNQYTIVDNNGNQKTFINDSVGFGLVQWTSSSRKNKLLELAKSKGVSIDNAEMQYERIVNELQENGYATCRKAIKENWSIEECTRIICEQYENPASMRKSAQEKENAIQNRINKIKDVLDILSERDKINEDKKENNVMSNNQKICLDRGHYGNKYNRGANPNYYESYFNWVFGGYLKSELEGYGFTVVDTRTDINKDLDLFERGMKAKGCALFYSVHSNACSTESVDRPVAIIPMPYGTTDNSRCEAMAKEIVENIHVTIGTLQAGKVYSKDAEYDRNKNGKRGDDEYYGVLHGAQKSGCPMYMIVEHGFHTNLKTANWLLVDSNIRKLAKSEAKIIAKHLGVTSQTAPTTNTANPTIVTNTVKYKILKGDTLNALGIVCGCTASEIQSLNPTKIKDINKISPNVEIVIPTNIISGTYKNKTWYVIQKNDTLSKIAKQFETSYLKIASLNGILNPSKIKEGTLIRVL